MASGRKNRACELRTTDRNLRDTRVSDVRRSRGGIWRRISSTSSAVLNTHDAAVKDGMALCSLSEVMGLLCRCGKWRGVYLGV